MSSERLIRVVHVVHWSKSGIVSLLRDILLSFDKKIFEQHVIFFEKDEETIRQFKGIAKSVTSLNFSFSLIMGIAQYRNVLHKVQPDILHTHSFLPTFLGDIFSNHYLHVITVHNPYLYFFEKNIKSILKRSLIKRVYSNDYNKVVAVSVDVQQVLLQTISKHMKVQVIENGIRVDDYKKACDNNKTDAKNSELISVGRLSKEKAYDVLLKAFKLVLQKKPHLCLTLIGDGPEREHLLSLTKELGIWEKVNFTGWIEAPYIYMTKKDFLYICSSEYEGFGLSVIEAMAMGLPIISTNVSGVKTFVKDNQTGFLVDSDNPQQLSDKIVQILEDDPLRMSVSKKGQQYVYDHYDISNTARQYAELYKRKKIAKLL